MLNLYLTDVLHGLRILPDKSVDVVVTSPPYNLGKVYKNNSTDRRKEDEYLRWTFDWTREVQRVLKDDGSFFLNLGGTPAYPYLLFQTILELRREFVLQNTFHWIKSITVTKRDGEQINAGHFKPLNSPRYVNDCHEHVFHFTKNGNVKLHRRAVGVPYTDKSNVARWGHTGGSDLRCRGNNWFLPYDTICNSKKQRPHPATFPVGLPMMAMQIHAGDRVHAMTACDPFVGIGSSALAALKLEIAHFHGIDNGPDYIQQAVERLQAERTVLDPATWLTVHRGASLPGSG